MFLICSSMLFILPVFFKKKMSQRINSGCLALVSSRYHYHHLIEKKSKWLRVMDKCLIYTNVIECIVRSNHATIVPLSLCTINSLLLFYVGVNYFSFKNNRLHEIEWSAGTFMHMLLHFNGVATIMIT